MKPLIPCEGCRNDIGMVTCPLHCCCPCHRETKPKKSLQQKFQLLNKKTTKYMEICKLRKEYARQADAAFAWLLKEGRCTKEDLKPFFKRKEEVLRDIK